VPTAAILQARHPPRPPAVSLRGPPHPRSSPVSIDAESLGYLTAQIRVLQDLKRRVPRRTATMPEAGRIWGAAAAGRGADASELGWTAAVPALGDRVAIRARERHAV